MTAIQRLQERLNQVQGFRSDPPDAKDFDALCQVVTDLLGILREREWEEINKREKESW